LLKVAFWANIWQYSKFVEKRVLTFIRALYRYRRLEKKIFDQLFARLEEANVSSKHVSNASLFGRHEALVITALNGATFQKQKKKICAVVR